MYRARDVMQKRFHTLSPHMTIAEAIEHFKRASEEAHRRVFGMIVKDEAGRLVGMLSMYDVLLLIRPKHTQVWGIMTDIEVNGLFEVIAERAQSVHVEDLMTTDVITIKPDTHVLHILDIMIKKHIRRLPVVNEGIIEGMVYLSDLFYFLVDNLSPQGGGTH
ncbi:MAG: CBS domain-containing protein [Desulfomonile tiedjei]|uniref:CBS domain-containing protein n=1 Tax=Desulfomonile tiedjei TaxID=2358 RepID=A0A9D6Z2B3_9BACT|nr:CBS domain-containing protein [Desulfomonile tiedjei]